MIPDGTRIVVDSNHIFESVELASGNVGVPDKCVGDMNRVFARSSPRRDHVLKAKGQVFAVDKED